jgi:hypothetical protein
MATYRFFKDGIDYICIPLLFRNVGEILFEKAGNTELNLRIA